MTDLRGIPIAVAMDSGNVPLLLHQVRHALEALLRDGTTTTIDLRAIPLLPGEAEQLLAQLGAGEVRAEVEASGRSTVYETALAGVWIIEHFDNADALAARFLEIATVPAWLLPTHSEMQASVSRLTDLLQVEHRTALR